MLTLSKAIAQCPKSMFGRPGKSSMDFPGIFALVSKAMLTDAGVKFDVKTIDALADIVNPSTLQRGAAARRATITGLINDDGTFEPVPEAKAKVAKVAKLPKAEKAPVRDTRKAGTATTKATKRAEAAAKEARTAPKSKRDETAGGMVRTKKEGPAPLKKSAKAKVAKVAKAAADTKLSALAQARAAIAAKKEAPKATPADAEDSDDVI